jgi:hypothetical protein
MSADSTPPEERTATSPTNPIPTNGGGTLPLIAIEYPCSDGTAGSTHASLAAATLAETTRCVAGSMTWSGEPALNDPFRMDKHERVDVVNTMPARSPMTGSPWCVHPTAMVLLIMIAKLTPLYGKRVVNRCIFPSIECWSARANHQSTLDTDAHFQPLPILGWNGRSNCTKRVPNITER